MCIVCIADILRSNTFWLTAAYSRWPVKEYFNDSTRLEVFNTVAIRKIVSFIYGKDVCFIANSGTSSHSVYTCYTS